eukprot:scaffold19681_cov90-Skeletonema_dohrnii-CCMP3373.AAC.2
MTKIAHHHADATLSMFRQEEHRFKVGYRNLEVEVWTIFFISSSMFIFIFLCITLPSIAMQFNNQQELESNVRWKKISAQIDDFSRIWIPISFFIALAILFARQVEGQ